MGIFFKVVYKGISKLVDVAECIGCSVVVLHPGESSYVYITMECAENGEYVVALQIICIAAIIFNANIPDFSGVYVFDKEAIGKCANP